MKKNLRIVSLILSLLCLSAIAFGQQNAGTIEGTVKDEKGAVVPGVSVTIQGVTVGFNRTVQTDSEGIYRVLQVPPGTYKISTAASGGFAAAKLDNISVVIEKTTAADITLGLAANVNTVEVSSDPLGVNVDVTDSKVQTNITSKLIEQLPKGQSFSSLLNISPGTRPEPLSGGFQVDGASGSENTFIVDGQPLENFRTGVLNAVNNIPTALVSEVQIKTGGFEAEHGGASGGVISVATKSGSDTFRGEIGTAFEPSRLQPAPRFALQRFVNSSSTLANINAFPDRTFAIAQPKDQYLNSYPTVTVSGPAIKRHIWLLGSYSPQIFETTRDSYFYNAIGESNFSTGKLVLTPRTVPSGGNMIDYQQSNKFEYAYSRVDAAFFNSLRGTVTYLWNPNVVKGNLPFGAISTSNPVNTTYGGVSYFSGDYARLQGGRTSSNNFTSQIVWTPSSKLVATFRYGRSFLNEKGGNYALANAPRYVCGGSSAAYATIATNCPGGIGFQNLTTNSITTRDVSIKNEFNADASYIVNGLGNHEFKGGYQRGQTSNDVLTGNAGTGTVTLFYGQDYTQAGTGVSLPCNLGTASCIGVGTLSRSGTSGFGQNTYQAIYGQDKWQPITRLTLNLGVRFEKEDLPSFNAGQALAGTEIPPIIISWGRKIAPRLGGAVDLFGDGKTKVYGSYGWFYDRLKFNLPRGLFGGDFFRVDYFPITSANPNYDFYTPARILGNFTDPRGGGNPSTQGGLSQLQRDFRIPSNLTAAQFQALGLPVTGVDPNLKPFRQSEITVGMDRELSNIFVLSARFTRKNVDSTIEDHAILGLGESENYPIGNPGEGYDLQLDQKAGYAKSAKPQRLYKGLEIILNKRLLNNYFFNVNYTFSKLFGNYSGLASSDEAGRTSPATDRFFDYAINGFTATGEPDNGYLATDRRHAFKAFGGYNWDWFGSKTNDTQFSFFQQILQGTPQTTFITVVATSIPLSKRGDLGRTPTFWQTDFSMVHNYKFGRDNRFRVAFDVNVLNLFNNNTVLRFNTTRYRVSNSITGSDVDPTYVAATMTLTNVLNRILNGQIGTQLAGLESGNLPSIQGAAGASTNGRTNPKSSLYGQPSTYQNARNVRFGMRFIF